MKPPEIALGFFLLLTVGTYWRHRSVLYPPFIFCSMWSLVLAIDCLHLIKVDPVHDNTLYIVCAGALAFSAGGWLAGTVPRELLAIHLFPKQPPVEARFLRNLLVGILLCALPVMFYEVLQLARGGTGFGILMRAREAQVEAAQHGETIHSLVLDYFVMLATLTSLLFATERRDFRFWIVTIVALVGCILSTGRTSLLLLIAGLCAIHLLHSKKESLLAALRLLRWPILLFVTLYVVLIFTNKNTKGMTGRATGVAQYFVLSYIVGPLSAFDTVVQNPIYYSGMPDHTFEFPLKIAAAMNLTSYTPPPKLDTFVMVPFPTNVYTVFKFYFIDVGTIGIIVLFLGFGLVHSLLYLKARHGGRFSTYLFAFSVYAALIVTFDDAYYAAGIYLRAFAFGLLYLMLTSTRLSLSMGKPGIAEDLSS